MSLIHYKDIDDIPTRESFLDPLLVDEEQELINDGEPFYFQMTDIKEATNWRTGMSFIATAILRSGQRICIEFTGVRPYFDVMVSEEFKSPDDLMMTLVANYFDDHGTKLFINYEIIEGKPYMGFHLNDYTWFRFYFKESFTRKKALHKIKESTKHKFITANDDDNNYLNLLARNTGFNTTAWNILTKYDNEPENRKCNPNIRIFITADYRHIKPVDEKDMIEEWMLKDKAIECCWDIETYMNGPSTGEAPGPDDDFDIISLAATFHWYYTEDMLVGVVLSTDINRQFGAIDPDASGDDSTTPYEARHLADFKRLGCQHIYIIRCDTERQLLKGYYKILAKMKPDYTTAFNGGKFDTPLYVAKLIRARLLVKMVNAVSSTDIYIPKPKSDDPKIIEEAERKYIERNYFRNQKVKISAEEDAIAYMHQIPGCIDIDTMLIYKQLYSTAEVGRQFSMNFYLKKEKLCSKEDMEYKRMFNIHEICQAYRTKSKCICDDCARYYKEWLSKEILFEGTKPYFKLPGSSIDETQCTNCQYNDWQMQYEVSKYLYYNIIDSFRCHQLMVKRTVISDRKEIGMYTYVSPRDPFLKAGSMRIHNIIGATCRGTDRLLSLYHETHPKAKFPGAHVFKPQRGLDHDYPTEALDFSSLYPSIMMSENIGADRVITDEAEAQRLISVGYKLHEVQFKYRIMPETPEGKKALGGIIEYHDIHGWIVGHNGNTTLTIDGKVITIGYQTNQDGTFIKDNKGEPIPIYGRHCLPNESMAIGAYALSKLFARRNAVKAVCNEAKELLEKMAADSNHVVLAKEIANIPGTSVEASVNNRSVFIEHVKFIFNKFNSKQNAIKILMNTMYGVSGSNVSPIYSLIVAGGVTTQGQFYIKSVASHLTSLGYNIKYGDSVTSKTPILITYTDITTQVLGREGERPNFNTTNYTSIGGLIRNEADWQSEERYHFNTDSNQFERILDHKQYVMCRDLWVWSDTGFTKVKKIIRHRVPNKPIYLITTTDSAVEVTGDHSLLRPDGTEVKPSELTVGDYLLATKPNSAQYISKDMSGVREKIVAYYADYSQHIKPLFISTGKQTEAAEIYNTAVTCSHMFPSVSVNIELQPININAEANTYDSQIMMYGVCIYVTPIKTMNRLVDPYASYSTRITSITCLGTTTQYVYDLETDSHHFAAGIGSIVVHNTDSNYLNCPKPMFAGVSKIFNDNLDTIIHDLLPDYKSITGEDFPMSAILHGSTSGLKPTYKTESWCIINDMYREVDTYYQDLIDKKQLTYAVYHSQNKAFSRALEYVKSIKAIGNSDRDKQLAYAQAILSLRSRNREDYWKRMVQITRNDVDKLKIIVNDFLTTLNNTRFLKMAYEEVLFPAVFTGKKKYFGYQHLKNEVFHPENNYLFIKGIDIVKQGQTQLSREEGTAIIQQICSVDNYQDPKTIILEKLNSIYGREIDLNYFIKVYKYKLPKPGKPGNKVVLPFVERQRSIYRRYEAQGNVEMMSIYKVPEPGDRIYALIVKSPQTFTIRGTKAKVSRSETLETVDVFKASQRTTNKLEIDFDHYMEKSIFNLFARFLTYCPEFESKYRLEYNLDDAEDYRQYDKEVVSNAKKFIAEYCAKLRPIDEEQIKKNVELKKRMMANHKALIKALKIDLYERYSPLVLWVLHGINLYYKPDDYKNHNGNICRMELESDNNESGENHTEDNSSKNENDGTIYAETIRFDSRFVQEFVIKIVTGLAEKQYEKCKDAETVTEVISSIANLYPSCYDLKGKFIPKFTYDILKCNRDYIASIDSIMQVYRRYADIYEAYELSIYRSLRDINLNASDISEDIIRDINRFDNDTLKFLNQVGQRFITAISIALVRKIRVAYSEEINKCWLKQIASYET
jgi:DNA polymerase elongation subunit (family B)